jgi:Skp family chaperone for outer membrane proteins
MHHTKQTQMKQLFFSLALICGITVSAQKVRVGVINEDSLMNTMPGYSGLVKPETFRHHTDTTLKDMDRVYAKSLHELDSLKPKLSPLMISLRKKQLSDTQANRQAFADEAEEARLAYAAGLVPYNNEFSNACYKAQRANICTEVLDRKAAAGKYTGDQAEFIDLNAAVAKELSASPALNAKTKRIGYINSDSLYALMPEYKLHAAAIKTESEQLNERLAAHDAKIKAKERENDSLGDERSKQWQQNETVLNDLKAEREKMKQEGMDTIAAHDDLRRLPNQMRIDSAIMVISASESLFYIYDRDVATRVWQNQTVEFVNVNAAMVKMLGLEGVKPEPVPGK